MIKNIEIIILRSNSSFEVIDTQSHSVISYLEKFSSDFNAVAFFYYYNLKKLEFSKIKFVKIKIQNSKTLRKIDFDVIDDVIYIYDNYDFENYSRLDFTEKRKLHFELVNSILKKVFNIFQLNTSILKEIENDIKRNKWQFKINALSKKINNISRVNILLNLELNYFSFFAEIEKKGIKKQILLFKSKPTYFVIPFLFKRIKMENGKLLIGNEKMPIFNVDINDETLFIFKNAKNLLKEWEFEQVNDTN